MRFTLNTFKNGLPKGSNGIYNSFTRVPPHTFDELLSRVIEYAYVEDNEMAAGVDQGKRQGAVEEMVTTSLIIQEEEKGRFFEGW